MYQCDHCKRIFAEPEMRKELMGEYMGAPAAENYPVCPYCGDEELIVVNYCPCGQLKEESQDWCHGCKEKCNEVMRRAILEIEQQTGMGYKDSLELLKTYFEEL